MRRLLTTLLALACMSVAAWAASPAVCYAVTSGNWNQAAIWSATSGGAGGTCAASGGAGVPIMGATATIAAGVPGAAGLFDRAVINTGITVHIPAGVGVQLGDPTYGGSGLNDDGVTVNGTSSTVYGALIVDAGGLLKLNGASALNDNYATINQYGVLQVAPGGSLWIGAGQNSPAISVAGRFYVGCGDQAVYPSPECAGNAGAWVTPSVASTLNFTAASLPAGLAAGDLVELSPTPQPLSFPYPYAIDGVTPPPVPPIMPQSNDTGTSPMKTCGTAATCVVPADTLVCVVAVSGNSVSLGWPQGGTPALPYCNGTETAMAITNAGVGQLWLKQPAFFWGDPTGYTWNTAETFSPSTDYSEMDATRSGIYILDSENMGGPISNAAGTGPGRFGDNSLSITSSNWGAPCTFLSIQAVTSAGCYVDYGTGSMVAYGSQLAFTGSMTFKIPSVLKQLVGSVSVPSGTRAYNEMVFANADVRYVYNGSGANGFIQFSTLPNTANNHAAFVDNTVKWSRGEVSLNGIAPSSSDPVEITGNSFGSARMDYHEYASTAILAYASSSYVDISNNYLDDWQGLFRCNLSAAIGTATQTFDHVTAVNNQVLGTYFDGGDNYNTCNWTNLTVEDNRITSNGDGTGIAGGYAAAFQTLNSTTSTTNLFKDNYVYGDFRGAFAASYQTWTNNFFAWQWHHEFTVTSFDGAVGATGGYVGAVKIDHNIMVTNSNQGLPCANSGYNQFEFIDGLQFSNNTCLVQYNGGGGVGSGGFEIGDSDSQSAIALAGLSITNNIVAEPTGIFKTFQGSPNFEQAAITYAGWNSAQATNAMYSGFATNPNTIPNPEVNRTVAVTQGGVNYNTSGSRNITGVTIQNPTYATATTGCLQYNYTSQSSITMAWSVDPSCASGVGFGTPVQLNWGGAATTYSITGAAPGPGGVGVTSMTLTASGTPFVGLPTSTGTGDVVPTGCPVDRWAWVTSGADAGRAYAIMSCPGTYNTATNQISAVPNDSGTLGTPTIAVTKWEVRLFDGGGTNYVDVGIDARSLPNPGTTKTLTDSGITLTPEDYCGSAQGCARLPVVAGMTVSLPVAMPILGGSSEQAHCNGQAACGGTSYYAPSGTAWETASDAGSYIGAVPYFAAPATMISRRH